MKFWKTLLVLLGFGAIWGFNMVVPGFAIVRSRCCEDIDSPLEEVSQDWQIADVVSGRVEWEPKVVLEHRANLATLDNPEHIEAGANSLASLGRFEEAKKLLQNLPATIPQLKTELAAKYQYFKYSASDFKDKQALSGAIETAKTLSPDYLKTTPRAVILATIIQIHEAYAFETLSDEQRVELWFKRVKELGIPAVRDSTIALIKEQGPKADPNLFFMLSVIDSTRSQNPNEMRCSLDSQQLAEKGIERHQIAFVDDMKSTGLFNFRHQGASAVDLLIKSANEYRSHRTKYMVDRRSSGTSQKNPDTGAVTSQSSGQTSTAITTGFQSNSESWKFELLNPLRSSPWPFSRVSCSSVWSESTANRGRVDSSHSGFQRSNPGFPDDFFLVVLASLYRFRNTFKPVATMP